MTGFNISIALGLFTLLFWSSLTMFLASSIVWTSRPIGEQNNCAKNCHLRQINRSLHCKLQNTKRPKTPVKHLEWKKQKHHMILQHTCKSAMWENVLCLSWGRGRGTFLLETVSWNTVLLFSSFRQDDDILSKANSTFALSLLKKLASRHQMFTTSNCDTLEPEKNKSCNSYNTTLNISGFCYKIT